MSKYVDRPCQICGRVLRLYEDRPFTCTCCEAMLKDFAQGSILPMILGNLRRIADSLAEYERDLLSIKCCFYEIRDTLKSKQ